ncbi:MAG: NUDIX domain-containing protein [Prolixibacteraceae bacterium]
MKIEFYSTEEQRNAQLKYVIICSRYRFDEWIFVRHKERITWEIPAGHIETGENPDDAAKRELFEETGAVDFIISPVTDYSVTQNYTTTFGRIYLAEVKQLNELPAFEIQEICMAQKLPDQLTYPQIQTRILAKIKKAILKQDDF